VQPSKAGARELHCDVWPSVFNTLLNVADDVTAVRLALCLPCVHRDPSLQCDAPRAALEAYLTNNASKAKAIKPALCRQQIMLYELTQQQ
jgi:hypothetical protein